MDDKDIKPETMTPAEMIEFVRSAQRIESIDSSTGFGLVCYWKNGQSLIYDQFSPELQQYDHQIQPTQNPTGDASVKLFNAIQITAAFVAWPFLVTWLEDASFRGAGVAFWSAIVFYLVAFIGMVSCVYDSIGRN